MLWYNVWPVDDVGLILMSVSDRDHKKIKKRIGNKNCTVHICTHMSMYTSYSRQLLIPKSKLTPRSLSAPRSQPISSYQLYSSLVFHCSQAPISVVAKRLTQPWFPSLLCLAKMLTIPTSQVIFPGAVMRQLRSIFQPQVSWRPEVKYIGRVILHQQSPFNPYNFYSPIPVSTPLTLTIPVLLDPRSCDLSSSDYYSSMISLV